MGKAIRLQPSCVSICILLEKNEKPYQVPGCHPQFFVRHKVSGKKQLHSLKIQ
jgi:hypothetical protein